MTSALPSAPSPGPPSRRCLRAVQIVPPLAVLCAAILLTGCAETMQSEDAAPLASSTWVAEDIGSRGVLDNLQSTLAFGDAGGVSGNAGCNQYTGSATVEAATITFSPLAATRMACVPAVDDQEQRFFDALGRVAGYELRIDGAILALLDADGAPVMTLIRME